MGGRGSGRRQHICGRPLTVQSTPLDVRRLARAGVLMQGFRGDWIWTFDSRMYAAITIHTVEDSLHLSWRKRCNGEVCKQDVRLTYTSCRFGGARAWFRCPYCASRVAVIYAPGTYYGCRTCAGVAYPSQAEDRGDRAARRADWIRERLGWSPGILNGSEGKPKGMHWKTFDRLNAAHDFWMLRCLRETPSLRHLELGLTDGEP